MENKELKNLELTDDQLYQAGGGTGRSQEEIEYLLDEFIRMTLEPGVLDIINQIPIPCLENELTTVISPSANPSLSPLGAEATILSPETQIEA